MRESKEEFRFQAREGFTIVEKGQQIRIERTAARAAGADLAQRCTSSIRRSSFRYARRHRGHLAVLLRRVERLLPRDAGPGRSAAARSAALAEAESAAQAAQVRALRYQVNPHFLFNTLNSLSSLIMAGRAERGRSR